MRAGLSEEINWVTNALILTACPERAANKRAAMTAFSSESSQPTDLAPMDNGGGRVPSRVAFQIVELAKPVFSLT